MKLFFDLVGFEYKKILCRRRTVIVLTAVILTGALGVFGTILGSYDYADENGGVITLSGYEDMMLARKGRESISGRVIGGDLIMEAVEAYRQSPSSAKEYKYNETVAKYGGIYAIVREVFHLKSIADFKNLTREQADRFDEARRLNWDTAVGNAELSENTRQYWQQCREQALEPLTYEYSGGFSRYIAVMSATAMLAGAAIAVLFSGIFADEYAAGVDSLILSAKHGKGLVIGAKLFVTFTISVLLIVLLEVISLLETGIVWGSGGAEGNPVLLGEIFPYPLTVGRAVLLYSLCAVMACVLFAGITAMLSAVCRTSVNTIIIMTVLLIAPVFIKMPEQAPRWVFGLWDLLPTNMMAFQCTMSEYQHEVFGLVVPPYVFMPVFGVVVSAVCVCFAYRGFKRHQIR